MSSSVVVDSNGTIYRTDGDGGDHNEAVAFEITQ